MTEAWNGTYKMKSSENFDEYMKALGVNFALRKLGNLAKPVLTVTVDGKDFYMKSESTVRTIETRCTIGVQFEEKTPDGRACKSIMTWDGTKMVHTQKWEDKQTVITRYMKDGCLEMDLEIDGIKAHRVYEKTA
uniref:Cytosolic fatty-acid binding proteins domain-containing protein n=1 Tax=Ciona savignyi TaxID=51511 RepID=H2ZG76_CIOSA